jgi:hypothetical protein
MFAMFAAVLLFLGAGVLARFVCMRDGRAGGEQGHRRPLPAAVRHPRARGAARVAVYKHAIPVCCIALSRCQCLC